MTETDLHYMEMAICEAQKQLERFGLDEGGERPDPKVGCVVVTAEGQEFSGYRGEFAPGEHAEFTVLEKKMMHVAAAGSTVYTTLEPCTTRNHPKMSCADRLIERKVKRVFIGDLDPDDKGKGYRKLRNAGINIEFFPPELVDRISEINRRFMKSRTEPQREKISSNSQLDDKSLEILNWYRNKSDRLAGIARSYYDDVSVVGFPTVTRQEWLPERPIPLSEIDVILKDNWMNRHVDTSKGVPLINENETYSEFLLRASPQIRQDNNFSYRLVNVEKLDKKLIFAFCPSYYRDYINTCNVLGYELAAWDIKNYGKSKGDGESLKSNRTSLPHRGPPEDIFDLHSRCACPGIVTTLIALNTTKGDYFYIYERGSNQLFDAPGGWHVVPAGQFQPDTVEDVQHVRDFSITRTMLREMAEELLGVPEVEVTSRSYKDFYDDPRVTPFVRGLETGAVRAYYMGFGFDPLPAKPGFYIALVIDASRMENYSLDFVDNWEGDSLAVPLHALNSWANDSRMIPDGAACLKLVARHLKFLLGDTGLAE